MRRALSKTMMRGFITERDFEEVDLAFPGIVRYYRELQVKPGTFLELLWGFTHGEHGRPQPVAVASHPAMGAQVG
jgi:hypothetical protein